MLFSWQFVSCDYLNVDKYIDDMTSLDSVFARKALLERYINGASDYLLDESRLYTVTNDPYQVSSDENFLAWNDGRHASTLFLQDELNEFTGFFSENYSRLYQGIRKANIIIARVDECQDISELDRRDYAGKAYFLRAYYYYLLLRQYGPVAIVPDRAFPADASVEDMSCPRNTYDECSDYICENMQIASTLLSKTRTSVELFQPTSGAALAVISRVRLHQASPWFNGNVAYADWKTLDNRYFISQVEDNSKWGVAALAAKAVIDTQTYSLHTVSRMTSTAPLPANVCDDPFPNGAGGIDPFRSYSEQFTGETLAFNNPELIYGCDPWRGGDESVQWIVMPQVMGGGNGLSLTQSLIDDYRMVDGRDITNSSQEYPYPSADEEYQPIGASTSAILNFSGYEIRPQVAKMYVNREPRFYATIGFCHRFWRGDSYLGNEQSFKNVEATYYKDGNCTPNASTPDDRCFSGYTLVKYVNPEDNLKGVIKGKVHPIIRYAEVLLNYAEALNELNQSYTNEAGVTVTPRNLAEICKAFNQIRYRAGQPGITEAEAADQSEMRKLIKRERKIEFACERMRFFDLRRWGNAMEEINKPIIGMNVEAKSNQRQMFYTRTTINYKYARRTFQYKMNFFPFHRGSMDKNSKLTQNPGW